MKPPLQFIYPENSVLMAPLAGYTDLAFRRVCRKYGCVYAFTPLVEAGSIVYGAKRSLKTMIRGDDEPWLGIQLLAADVCLLKQAARKIRNLPFDVIDFNMGCPVRKVTRRGAGAALCDNPSLAVSCVEALSRYVKVPVTAKIRVVSGDCNGEKTVDLANRLLEAGISCLTIHGRMKEQVYSGPVWTNVIARVKESLTIPVIANGGVVDVLQAAALRDKTGCSRIMVARGAIGNPWLFRSLFAGKQLPPSHEEVCRIVHEHVLGVVELYGEEPGMRYVRKIISAYFSGRGYRRSLRCRVTNLASVAQFEALMQEIEAEGPLEEI